MNETIPRWALPAVEFVDTDAAQISNELFAAYEGFTGRTLAEGDPVRLFLLSIAEIIAQQRIAINYAGQQNILSYAQGEYLDSLGRLLAVDRLQASYATTTVLFTLSHTLGNPYTIPAGFLVTNGVITFATNDELTIEPGNISGAAVCTCTTAGAVGNGYAAGDINTIVSPLAMLATAENTTESAGGADIEGDPEYAERIRLAPNMFSVAGPKKAYIYHAMSVNPGIVDVNINSPSPGVVEVYPLMEGGEIPSEEILEQVYNYLSADDIRPLTDEVRVLSPVIHNYSIHVEYWINEADRANAANIRARVEAAVNEYKVWQQSKIGRDIAPGQLVCKVIGAGAARIDDATLTPAGFVELESNAVAQCENINIVYRGYKTE